MAPPAVSAGRPAARRSRCTRPRRPPSAPTEMPSIPSMKLKALTKLTNQSAAPAPNKAPGGRAGDAIGQERQCESCDRRLRNESGPGRDPRRSSARPSSVKPPAPTANAAAAGPFRSPVTARPRNPPTARATPSPLGTGTVCEERSFGMSKMARRRSAARVNGATRAVTKNATAVVDAMDKRPERTGVTCSV